MKPTAALVLVLALIGCGGTAAAPPSAPAPSTPPTTTPPPTSGGTSSGSAPAAPTVVNVSAGQTTSGINITVVAPAAPTAPNAKVLGVSGLTGGGSAYNTGDSIHVGQTARVLLFGPGLDGTMQVNIVGPPGITVSGVTSIQATDNTPGISFVATVAPNAALGGRTVWLQTTHGDVTTFTGGLEVVP